LHRCRRRFPVPLSAARLDHAFPQQGNADSAFHFSSPNENPAVHVTASQKRGKMRDAAPVALRIV
jgi:hypothetical protein